ncbi:MAG: hypothetical protein Q3980_13075 [Turicibacter sp.]|nr:hypothetical protein [Turicibacter sp.]
MITTGIKVKEYISEEDSTGIIVVKNEIFHDTYTQEEYEDFLQELIEDKQMKQTTFKENKWVLFTEFWGTRSIEFPFEFNQEVNNLLKKYLVFKFKIQNITPNQIQGSMSGLIKVVKKTKFFHLNQLVDFIDEIKDFDNNDLADMMYVREFLRFSQIPNSEQYYDALKHVPNSNYGSRALPSYKSIMTFDYIINDFILNGSEELKLKYYPVLIWWQLTKIVPLRPIELSLLERDWLYQKNGSYFIKIERRKKRQGQIRYQTIPPLTEVEISKELFDLIHHYIDLGRAFNNAPYILDYEFAKHNLNQTVPKNKVNTEFSTNSFLNNTLRFKFFEEIVRDHYGYKIVPKQDEELDCDSNEIEMITLGDTRHIAICSMMLQGMNEFTIAQMAGHNNLTEQIGYCNHLDSYATAYTHRMAKSFQNSFKFNINDEFETKELAQKQKISMALLTNSLGTVMKVDNGYCQSKNFPLECEIDDCLFCPHFVGSRDMSQVMLEQKAEMLDRQIKTKLDYIKSVVSRKIDFKDDTDSKTNIKSLNTDLKRKALVEAHMYRIRKD